MYPDVERPRIEREGRTEGLEKVISARSDEAESIRVSTRRDWLKGAWKEKGVSRPPNSTNRTQKTILSPTKPNVHSLLKHNQKIYRKTTGHSPTTDKCIIILTLFS